MRIFSIILVSLTSFILLLSACRRDEVRPDYFNPQARNSILDSILADREVLNADATSLLMPDGRNVRDFLLNINPALDSLFPRNGEHPFYGMQGNELRDLIIAYITVRAANAFNEMENQFPGSGDGAPTQNKLGYAAGSHQTDLRTPGAGSLAGCPQIFGLDEIGYIIHLLEGAYLTLPQNFHPDSTQTYNDALGITGLSAELEFQEIEDIAPGNILAGDIFVMFIDAPGGIRYNHYGIVLTTSDDVNTLMLSDCFADVHNQDCKTDIGLTVGPRLVSLNFLINDVTNIENVGHKVIRLKKKLHIPLTSETDPDYGFETVRFGNKIWMAEDLDVNGRYLLTYNELDLDDFPTRGACPQGWHIPSKEEWEELFTHLNATAYPWPNGIGHPVWYYQGVAPYLKSTTGWSPPGVNLFQFNVEPRGFLVLGTYQNTGQGEIMGYWTSTHNATEESAYSIIFENDHNDVLMDTRDYNKVGYGCRCVKNELSESTDDCMKVPIVFHILKCSDNPTHQINNLDISPIYDQIAFLNNQFSFSGYCVEFYLACENDQPVFEIHDICDGSFAGVDPSKYLHTEDSLKYTSFYIRNNIVSQIQVPNYDWPSLTYLNVYIAITGDGAISAYPGTLPERSAIVMPVQWIGGEDVAYSEFDEGRSMSLGHEIGHYFDLQHPWGGVDIEDVYWNGAASCAGMNNGIFDLVKFYGNVFSDTVTHCINNTPIYNSNIMSYSRFGVATKFTMGQIGHMEDILTMPAGMNGRSELVRTFRECRE